MNVPELLSNIHWIPVISVTIFSFVLGALWHHKFLFGNPWKKENNPQNIPVKINAPLIFGGTALMHFMAIAALSAIISGKGGFEGMHTGLAISFFFILPAMTGTYLFANRSLKLLAIDAGMYILLFGAAGFILGIW